LTTSTAEVSTTEGSGETPITTVSSLPETTLGGATSTTVSDREPAPDFTLALGDGGTFTLSESDKPVYLVFWAEWCPTCRRELPYVDQMAAEFGEEVDFVAPAWKGTEEATAERATEFFRSGQIKWGLDADEEIFDLYAVPYQPVTFLIAADDTIVDSWPGVRGPEAIRTAIEGLISVSS
jgi:thiol-disulfide isomerase/thioredoxin